MILDQHLKQVSRSFAFCIAELSPGLRERVSVMYLFCRVLDTIEDASDLSFELKESIFSEILEACQSLRLPEPSTFQLSRVRSQFFKESEVALLQDFPIIFEQYYQNFDPSSRQVICELLAVMSAGMLHFEKKRHRLGRLVIESTEELEHYCYVVAGCVGEALSRLVFGEQVSENLLKLSRDFGSFLQKINMIKDRTSDEKEGRDFLGFVASRQAHEQLGFPETVRSTWLYIEQLGGRAHERFRLFCAWSFALGLRTLALWEGKNFSWSHEPLKISKLDALQIVASVKGSNQDLQNLREVLKKTAPTFSQNSFSALSSNL